MGRHDRRAAEISIDLQRWMTDRDRELERYARDVQHTAGKRYSGTSIHAQVTAREQVLHEYRDRASAASRAAADLADEESLLHNLWRRWKKLEPVAVLLSAEAREILSGRRADVDWQQVTGAEPAPVRDGSSDELELRELEGEAP